MHFYCEIVSSGVSPIWNDTVHIPSGKFLHVPRFLFKPLLPCIVGFLCSKTKGSWFKVYESLKRNGRGEFAFDCGRWEKDMVCLRWKGSKCHFARAIHGQG
eukprot:EG_transcript_35456